MRASDRCTRPLLVALPVLVSQGCKERIPGGRIVVLNPTFNGDLEMEVASTAHPGSTIYASCWCNAEDKVVQRASAAGGLENRGIVLAEPGEHVIQRFPAYEYLARGRTGTRVRLHNCPPTEKSR